MTRKDYKDNKAETVYMRGGFLCLLKDFQKNQKNSILPIAYFFTC